MSQKSADSNATSYTSQLSTDSNSSKMSTSINDSAEDEITADISKLLDKDLNLHDLISSKTYFKYDPECLRKKSNWSKTRSEYKFDNLEFNPRELNLAIHTHSSKLESLLKRINDLDKRDMEKDGHMYKHFIFSDLKMGLYGAKLIAGALIAKGMHMGYNAQRLDKPKNKKNYEKIELDDDETLLNTKSNNFYLLSSVPVYDRPISVAMKKSILKKFNQRPENVNGELARIMVMDSGFKEGIDLFDIKYVHIFEPQTTVADQKQIIGRGTRTCGQKGLQFHPTKGWSLNVFIYDVDIPEKLQSQMLDSPTLFDLYMKSMNLDFRLFNFQHDLERNTVYGSVDYELNRDIHNFAIAPNDDMIFGGAHKKFAYDKRRPKLILGPNVDKPMNFEENREYIRKYFSNYKWKDIRMENNCAEKQVGGAELIQYTPTQDFVRNYFTPQNPLKGMFLWHSVGTGKTCSAIAAATSSFEKEGYTILWVTRTTLKNDIWKNMFDQICNESVREKVESGIEIPEKQSKRMSMLAESWSIRPMSYKQFSNLVLKQNSFYDALVKKNGEADPLHKTLLIIDEAHKLYGGDDLSSLERPDMNAFVAALQNSYMVSGKDSVRLMIMTATPITGNPMELIKLVNLLKPMDKQIPDTFPEFSEKYLNEDGRFTENGEKQYLDDIAGHISYLNREKDARQFAQPIVRFVNSPLVENVEEVSKLDSKLSRELYLGELNELQKQVTIQNNEIDDELKNVNALKFGFLKEKCNHLDGKAKSQCEKVVRKHISDIVKDSKSSIQKIKDNIKELKTAISEKKRLRKDKLGMKKNDSYENVENTEKLQQLKQSMYYTITHGCGKKINEMQNLNEVVTEVPEIEEIDNYMISLDDKINKSKQELDIIIRAHKNRVKQIKELMRTDITIEERNLLRRIIKSENKTAKKNKLDIEKAITLKSNSIEKIKKLTMKKRKRVVNRVKLQIKEVLKQDKEDLREQVRMEKEEEKLRQKQGIYTKEINSNVLKDIVNNHEKMIDTELSELTSVFETMEKEQQEKEEAKKQKSTIAATKKQQKALDAEHRKTMKLQQVNAKKMEKQEKATEKELEKQEKAAAKELEKQEKAVAKELAKQERAHAISSKKLQMEQKKLNKTVKNKKPLKV